MYAQSDVLRLKLLAEATRAGKSISRLVQLDNSQLVDLVAKESRNTHKGSLPSHDGYGTLAGQPFFEGAFQAMLVLDTEALDTTYQAALVKLGDQGFLRQLITPLARAIGERWRAGLLTAAQEHFFTAMSKVFLWNLTRKYSPHQSAPRIVVGTPAGQLHDLGAVIVAAAAANNGWRVSYVGAGLPAFELAGAVAITNASALALSIVYPEDDPKLASELEQLERLLPESTRLFVGGRASHAYLSALRQNRTRVLNSLEEFDTELDELRRNTTR
jgi:methanogenic corrinoid protein MtbC1